MNYLRTDCLNKYQGVQNKYLLIIASFINERYTEIVPVGCSSKTVYDLHPASLTVMLEGSHELLNI